jgi:hypothetical protein
MSVNALLTPLSCPRCGKDLDGGDRARIFLCRPCGLASHGGDPADVYPLRYAAAAAGAGTPDLFAPFWRVEGEFSWQTEDRRKQRTYQNLHPLGPLLFPAFWSPRAAYHDDLTLLYARRPELIVLRAGNEPLLDGIRSPKALGELARLAWLAYFDRTADVTGVGGRFEVKDLAYVGVPFFKRDDRFEDGVLGCKVPASYFSL